MVVQLGRPHPDPVAESSSLAAIKPLMPEKFELRIAKERKKVIDDGLLSSLQLESVILATTRWASRRSSRVDSECLTPVLESCVPSNHAH